MTGLGAASSSTAAAAPAASVRGTAPAAGGCVRVIATIPVGTVPMGVATTPRTNTIYVTNSVDNTVSVISGRTNKVVATIPVGNDPFAVAANPRTNTAYVANDRSRTVSVLAPCSR
jgi:YVTN family beta-propeller protein